MTAQEFGEWMALYELEPWGETRADIRAGVISSTIANVHRGKRTEAYKFTDFMLFQQKDEADQQQVETDPRAFLKRISNDG